jgi:replication factor C large subunit
MPWTEKHRPKNFEEVRGQGEAVEKIRNFYENFNSSGKSGRGVGRKAMILHGPPGTGKTTLAYVLANETDLEIFELNASDLRNRDKLREILKPATEQKSLLKKGKIILVDEVDGISAADWGGLTELLSLIETSSYPVFLTANDVWDRRLSPLRRKSEIVQLKEIPYSITKDVLISILRKEGQFVNNDILTGIAIKSKGDLRAAINDLQIAVGMEDPSKILESERNKQTDIFNALRLIFKEKATEKTLRIFDNVKMPLDQIILWVEENIPAEYQGEELAKAFDALSKADLFRGRIYKQQYWRFLVYENILLSYGIAAKKEGMKRGFTSYRKPTRILKIWMNNQRTAKKKSIAEKYARCVHVGKKRALNEFPIISQIIKSNPKISKELKLDEEEIEYLNNEGNLTLPST